MASHEEYLSLSGGETFIRWDVPHLRNVQDSMAQKDSTAMTHAKSPTILLLHGATVPLWQFDLLVPYLLKYTGYRILRIDLYGHGNSSMATRNNVKFDMSLFIEQVREVLWELGRRGDLVPDSDMFALGHSLGAAVVSGVASLPRPIIKIRKILLCAPMLHYAELQPHVKAMMLPFVGEFLISCVIIPYLRRRRKKRYGAIGCYDLGERFVQQTQVPGYPQALLSIFRDGCLNDQMHLYQNLAESDVSVKVMYGSKDNVANEEQIRRIVETISATKNGGGSDVHVERFEGLEHNLLMSHPEISAKSVADFFAGADGY